MDTPAFDARLVREDFPALHQNVYGKPLVYLDNAATTQKPRVVIDRLVRYYEQENCNIHRGVHYLSQQATDAFEQSRRVVAETLNARHGHEIIFTKGATASINLVSHSIGKLLMKQGSTVLVTAMEHHSNLVPWQQLCKEYGSQLLVARINEQGELDLDHYLELLKKRPVMAAFTHISNALGTINPVKEMTRMAHESGVPVLIDGAQAVAHMPVDMQDLDCDFYVFSGHKVYAPMGVGVLYAKEQWLHQMTPWEFGGEMVDQVGFDETTFNELPFKFEAGTPDVGAVLGLGAALNYLHGHDLNLVKDYEDRLVNYAFSSLSHIPGIRIIGQAEQRSGLVSFLLGEAHPYDVGTLLDKMGIAVRTGHHCAQPVMDVFGIPGTVRASFAMYNTFEEVDILCSAVKKTASMLL